MVVLHVLIVAPGVCGAAGARVNQSSLTTLHLRNQKSLPIMMNYGAVLLKGCLMLKIDFQSCSVYSYIRMDSEQT